MKSPAHRGLFRGIGLCAVLSFVIASRSLAAEFTATLDRDAVVLGETATLTLSFKDGQPHQIPSLPAIPNLQVSSQGTSQAFNQLNNQVTAIVSYTFALTPTQAGEYSIPSITAVVEGQRLTSAPLKLTALASDPASPPVEYADKLAFLWLVLPKTNLYVGEVVVPELRLYVRNGIVNISDIELPPLAGSGLVAGKYTQGGQYQRRVGASSFAVVPVRTTLMAARSGLLTLSPLKGSVVVHVPSRQRSAFDLFGPPTVSQAVELMLDAQTVLVHSLPRQGMPENFNGAVGKYTLAYTAGPTNLPAGDPITVHIQISGEGALDNLSLPAQSWDGFKTIPPTSTVKTDDALGIRGRKLFEQIVVPQSESIRQVPPITFSFFDPDQKGYRTLSSPAIPLHVRPGGAAATPVVAASNGSNTESTAPTPDIVPIKQRPGTLAQATPPLLRQPWFLGLQAVPVVAFAAAVYWRHRRDSLANNPRLKRRRQVAESIRIGLNNLKHRANANDSDGFFSILFHLLQEKLGERLDLPASSITESVIEERLRPLSVPEDTLNSLHELFQTCNLVRYAPIKSPQELAAFIPRLHTVLRELDAVNS